MARKHHNPGCPCCECFDTTYTDDYSSFTTADGEYDTDRWVLPSGDVIESGPRSVGEAWFHTLHIKNGDCDLTWDGITIEYRDAGTITNGTNSSIFMPGSVPPADWEEGNAAQGTYITLWVTPAWYVIMISRQRLISGLDSNTRGSVQVINRDNTSAPSSLSVTAVGGDLEIASWRIADATVTVEGGYAYGEITRECPKPDKWPQCTERFFQSQQALLTRLTWDHTIDRYEIVDGPPGDPPICQFLDTQFGGLSLYLGSDLVTAWPDGLRCDLQFGFLITGEIGSNQPNPESSVSVGQNYTLPDSEPATPYPKPQARLLAGLGAGVVGGSGASCDDSEQIDQAVFVDFGSDSRAAGMISLSLSNLDDNYFSCYTSTQCAFGRAPGFSDPVRVLTDISIEWDAE